jgi:hypothetical protein
MNNFFWIPEIFEADVQEKTRIEILDTNSERHSIVERAEEKKRGFFFFFFLAYIPAFGFLVNQQIFEVSAVI